MTDKPKRIRKQRLDLALEAALRDAADACKPGVDAGLRILINSRLQILSHRLRREENGKLVKAQQRIVELEGENTRLKSELAARSVSPADDIRAVLEGGRNVQGI
jgi:hypothetical protein